MIVVVAATCQIGARSLTTAVIVRSVPVAPEGEKRTVRSDARTVETMHARDREGVAQGARQAGAGCVVGAVLLKAGDTHAEGIVVCEHLHQGDFASRPVVDARPRWAWLPWVLSALLRCKGGLTVGGLNLKVLKSSLDEFAVVSILLDLCASGQWV